MNKYAIVSLLMFSIFSIAEAQANVSVGTATIEPVKYVNPGLVGDVEETQLQCVDLKYTLKVRSKDATTNNEVTALQEFLLDIGLLDTDPTGYFGAATLKAVKAFQKQSGLINSGLVGVYTRQAIKEKSCNQSTSITPKKETEVYACTMEYRACSDGSAMPREANCKWREDKCPSSEFKNTKTYESSEGLGEYIGYLNGEMFIKTASISKQEAYSNCKLNNKNNPKKAIKCTWKGEMIYSTSAEAIPEQYQPTEKAFGPGKNAMNCSSPAWFGLENGKVGCYGIWDYGNEFGGDPDMCPQYGYSKGSLGCVVKTKACSSGQAVASKMVYPTSMNINSSELATYAMNLKSTTDAVKQQIPTLWEYTCTAQAVIDEVNTTKQTEINAVPKTTTSGAELHVVGVYEASSDHSFCHSTTGAVSVTVKNTGKPVILAVSSYEPVTWNIKLEPGAQLERVIVGGYGVQKVKGISDMVPTTMLSYYSFDNVNKGVESGAGFFYDLRSPDSGTYYDWASQPDACPKSAAVPIESRAVLLSGSEYYYSYKINDDGYDKWLTKLKAITGVRPTSFQGYYSRTSFEVGATVVSSNIALPSTASILGASTMCARLSRNMHRGDESEQTKMLQTFLNAHEFMDSEVSGFYGDKTVEAVKRYQRNKELPETGMVYNATRLAIENDSCR